jgi:hypothetical protein
MFRRPVAAPSLRVTTGQVSVGADGAWRVDTGGMRAVVAGERSDAVELSFVYQGPSSSTSPLASGELRRQIGIKLRAQDDCNVVYVMWHVDPSPGVYVSIKRNPGQAVHLQCGAHGYVNLKSALSAQAPRVLPGERHVLRAVLSGAQLQAFADGVLVFSSTLPQDLLTFDGPPGVRSDHGAFEFALRLASPGPP